MVRYFDTGTSNVLCSACHPTCLTCSGSLNIDCLACNSASFRVYDSATHSCKCDTYYYQSSPTI